MKLIFLRIFSKFFPKILLGFYLRNILNRCFKGKDIYLSFRGNQKLLLIVNLIFLKLTWIDEKNVITQGDLIVAEV